MWVYGPDGGWGAKGSYLGRARSRRPIQAAVALWRGIKLEPTAGPNPLRGGTTPWECQSCKNNHLLMRDGPRNVCSKWLASRRGVCVCVGEEGWVWNIYLFKKLLKIYFWWNSFACLQFVICLCFYALFMSYSSVTVCTETYKCLSCNVADLRALDFTFGTFSLCHLALHHVSMPQIEDLLSANLSKTKLIRTAASILMWIKFCHTPRCYYK